MALALWEREQRRRGNTVAADMAVVLLKSFGDILINMDSCKELITSEKAAWSKFLGQEINIPTPPQELIDTLNKAQKIGWIAAEAHFFPKIQFEQGLNFPGWSVKPEDYYWQKIKEAKIPPDAATFEGIWVVADGSQKPQYQHGIQMYENDPFSSILAKLRKDGEIQVPDWNNHIPATSRFGINNDELQIYVNPAIVDLLGVQPEQVRQPKAIEFNILGNLFHPEWGETNTWEWFEDKFSRHNLHLIGSGGDYAHGNLGRMNFGSCRDNYDNLGFRPLVTFPPKAC